MDELVPILVHTYVYPYLPLVRIGLLYRADGVRVRQNKRANVAHQWDERVRITRVGELVG